MLQTTIHEALPTNQDETATATDCIRALNDAVRQGWVPPTLGRTMITRGIQELGAEAVAAILRKVRGFSDFNEDNDPHGEHDFGSFMHAGQKIFWKFDYYDPSLKRGSSDPSDPAATCRVLTILLASEY